MPCVTTPAAAPSNVWWRMKVRLPGPARNAPSRTCPSSSAVEGGSDGVAVEGSVVAVGGAGSVGVTVIVSGGFSLCGGVLVRSPRGGAFGEGGGGAGQKGG